MKRMGKYARERHHKKRPRKILSLEERVEALRMFVETPVYQRVAEAFHCSWEQIKTVVSNQDSILAYYARCQTVMPGDTTLHIHKKKIIFLGNVVFEFVKRVFYHGGSKLDEMTVREKALQFRDIIGIDQFYPNSIWFADFKRLFNIELPNPTNIVLVKTPQESLDSHDIVNYCRQDVQTLMERAKLTKQRKELINKRVVKMKKAPESDLPPNEDYRDSFGRDINCNGESDDENEEGIIIDYSNFDSNDGMNLATLAQMLSNNTTVSVANATAVQNKTNIRTSPRKAKQTQDTNANSSKSQNPQQNRPSVITAAKRSKIDIPKTLPTATTTTTTTMITKTLPATATEAATAVSTKKIIKKSLPTATVTTKIMTTPKKVEATASTAKPKTEIANVKHALEYISPLQDYALISKDFVAMNLLNRLVQHFEKKTNKLIEA